MRLDEHETFGGDVPLALDVFRTRPGEPALGEFAPEQEGGELSIGEPPAEDGSLLTFVDEWRAAPPLRPQAVPARQPPRVRRGGSVGSTIGWVAFTLAIGAAGTFAMRSAIEAPSSSATSRTSLLPVRDDLQTRALAAGALFGAPVPLRPVPPDVLSPEPTGPASKASLHPADPAGDEVRAVLDRYRQSFDALDVAGIAAVWPGADRNAVGSAFSAVRYQSLSFDRCQVQLTSADRAVASCAGAINDVAKSGDPAMRHRQTAWTFELRRAGSGWVIDRVVTA